MAHALRKRSGALVDERLTGMRLTYNATSTGYWKRGGMAREDVAELYRELCDGDFSFVPRGEHHIRDLYALVKLRFPKLCDDQFLRVVIPPIPRVYQR